MAEPFDDITIDLAMRLNKTQSIKNISAIKSGFSGESFPSAPIVGQKAFVNNKLYIHNGTSWVEQSLAGHSHNDLYYTENEITSQLNGKQNTGTTVNNSARLDGHPHTVNTSYDENGFIRNNSGVAPSIVYVNYVDYSD